MSVVPTACLLSPLHVCWPHCMSVVPTACLLSPLHVCWPHCMSVVPTACLLSPLQEFRGKLKTRADQWQARLPDVDRRLLEKVLRLQDQEKAGSRQSLRGTLLPDARRTVERWMESASEPGTLRHPDCRFHVQSKTWYRHFRAHLCMYGVSRYQLRVAPSSVVVWKRTAGSRLLHS